jgi:hypothetical protein
LDVVRLVCDKVKDKGALPGFNRLHQRAILCFTKHRRLNLFEAIMLMDEKQKKTKQVLEDLVQLEVLKYYPPDYLLDDPFEALYKLIRESERKRLKKK